MAKREIRFGVVGVKGFSTRHLSWVSRAAEIGAPVKLAAVATIVDDEEAKASGEDLAKNGVKVVRDYDDLLAMHNDVDIITLPVGIHLHESLTSKALRAGFPVYMEKPAAGTVEEVAKLAEAERESGKRLFVGFQTLFQPSTWMLKKQLLDGVIGKLEKIVITVAWPRFMSYYNRNRWAGKIEIDGRKIYDCPMNNSSAHFLNAALFLAGPTPEASAVPAGVKTELYHASPIGSADSDFSRFTTREGVEIVFNASQACTDQKDAVLDFIGDEGSIQIIDQVERLLAPWVITDAKGRVRKEGGNIPRVEVFERVATALVDPGMREFCTIRNAGMHTAANQMAFTAGTIRDIPGEYVEKIAGKDGDEMFAIKGMNQALETMRKGGLLPSETGVCGWSHPADSLEGEPVKELLSKIIA